MNMNELYPSKYLKAEDIDGEVVATIVGLKLETMKNAEGKEDQKPVLYFRGIDKGFVLNKTNGTRIAGMHGDESDNWVGKKITLHQESVTAFGETQWAIRVKPTPPPAKATAIKSPSQSDDSDFPDNVN